MSAGTSYLCSFYHLLNMVWQPLLRYIEGLDNAESPSWTKELQCHQDILTLEMVGIVPSVREPLSIDDWVELIRTTVVRLVGVTVSTKLIHEVVKTVAPLDLDTTPANVMHLLRTSLCAKLVGPSLATQINRKILAEVADLPVPLISQQDLGVRVKADLAATLERLHCPQEDLEEDSSRPAKRLRKNADDVNEMLKAKTQQVLWTIENNVRMRRMRGTVMSCADLISDLTSNDMRSSKEQLESLLVSRQTLAQHTLLLDGALDRVNSDLVFSQREAGTFAGVALASDESPPKQPRFRGLRFQITIMFLGTFAPRSEWESASDPPIICRPHMADIMHCPGKKGVDVSRVLEKQLARVGLNCWDVVASTGDGGPENEGHQGLHAHFENLSPGYVRHRCLPHIAWRTADMAIRASSLDYKSLAAYLVEGITWSRLREIATRSLVDGGLNLFRDGSAPCKNFFGQAPVAIVSTRPQTDLNFLRLLSGKEHLLHRLATKDLEQRRLGAETTAAVQSLADIKLRVQRAVLAEIIDRCLYLMKWNDHHTRVASDSSWEEIMTKATSLILDLEVTPRALEALGMTQEHYQGLDPQPKTWVELLLLQMLGEQQLVADRLQEALDFHRTVTDTAAGHLALLADNTFRTPWLAAKLLSKDKHKAQAAAKALARHLATTRPSNRTHFEEHLFGTTHLWENLVAFGDADPPVLLWHGQGQYQSLFEFIAPRFLLAPDHVLHCERVHARWQWILEDKRSLKMHTLNASLRMQFYLENNAAWPTMENLLPHLQAEREQHRVEMAALRDDGEVALGWRQAV